ncbi:MAG: bifunctional adenosylcobinamide kinase/adenosylcobinamide-phosphate guanylyltransferase [Deltaproteobacteria bacterium]|jgi:Adenosyl cobinamide kinase/adenosyl cobinamide phosphate guanylyltransferase|nr:bifunctional adenosylcobinamide kinase/adenosylcobinamide-phosphate guanylyltransferase [Deltaproteobacteria bacterium]MDA8298987.1 bifunctional adenosylcobinamide kinase/adenosylcobinamide-phosphate guanylyltransferase [Deltaproteobacteria bacterium]
MAKIFITGGISSGKSQFAENTALALYKSNMNADAGMSDGILTVMRGGAETDAGNFPLLHFIATANTKIKINAKDDEMLLKIKKHKEKRNKTFIVHENFDDLTAEIDAVRNSFPDERIAERCVILIDSMTLWLSSFFTDIKYFDFAAETVLKFSEYLSAVRCSVITVSDSLGFNLVSVDAYVRKFVELNGLMEQKLSAVSDKAYCVIAGNPLALK